MPARDVNRVNNTSTLAKLSLPTYTSFGNIKEYRNLTSANYAFVEFSGSNPATSITYGPEGYLVYIGYLGDISTFLILIGIVAVIAGGLLNNNFKLRDF